MLTFDQIEIHRPELARSYLSLLTAQPGRPLALFAPRRIGKTFFLNHDLAPAATERGFVTVYADLWLQRNAPLEAINHALEEKLDDLTIPAGTLGKLAKTPIKKIGAASASVELGEKPARRTLPTNPALRLDALVMRIHEASQQPLLLMLDEIQSLGEAPDGESIIASLRAVFQKRKQQLFSVFTGSSQSGMAKMLATAGTPMYQFAQLMDFPVLGEEFVKRLAEHFATVHAGRSPLVSDLNQLFTELGYKPGLLKDVVKAMSAEGLTNTRLGLQRYMASNQHVAGWRALLDALEPFDLAVLHVIARGLPALSKSTLEELSSTSKDPATLSKVRSAIERLQRQGIVAKIERGSLLIDDPLLREYLAQSRRLS